MIEKLVTFFPFISCPDQSVIKKSFSFSSSYFWLVSFLLTSDSSVILFISDQADIILFKFNLFLYYNTIINLIDTHLTKTIYNMQLKTIWQLGSNNPENLNNLDTIRQWWAAIADKEISWRQRIIPASGDITKLDWEPQRFDEIFEIQQSEIRGITLYWRKPNSQEESNTTVQQLALHHTRQELYIFPKSQQKLVIRVALPEVKYQRIEINNPEILVEKNIILFLDNKQLLEVQIKLTPEQLNQLKEKLK